MSLCLHRCGLLKVLLCCCGSIHFSAAPLQCPNLPAQQACVQSGLRTSQGRSLLCCHAGRTPLLTVGLTFCVSCRSDAMLHCCAYVCIHAFSGQLPEHRRAGWLRTHWLPDLASYTPAGRLRMGCCIACFFSFSLVHCREATLHTAEDGPGPDAWAVVGWLAIKAAHLLRCFLSSETYPDPACLSSCAAYAALTLAALACSDTVQCLYSHGITP